MKKTLILIVLCFLLMPLLTSATTTKESDVERRIDLMNVLSAKRGLLEFEKGITRNLLRGEVVQGFIKQNHPDVDVSRLAEALVRLSDLKQKTRQIHIEETEPEVIKNWFKIALQEYRDLVQGFHEEAQKILHDADTSALEKELEKTDLSEIDELNQKIHALNEKIDEINTMGFPFCPHY